MVIIECAEVTDIAEMVELSRKKRLEYEKVQPRFWKYKKGAEDVQVKWFKEFLEKDDCLLLVAKSDDRVVGFAIGSIIQAPEVYDPGGLTLMIDDFCVDTPENWNTIGSKLIEEIKKLSKAKDVVQILVVCGAHDEQKRQLLKNLGLNVISEWYSCGI